MHSTIHDTDPELPAVDVVGDTIADARELVRIELAIARDDLRRELAGMRLSAALGVCAIASSLLGLAMLFVGLGVTLGPVGAVALTVALLAIAVATGALAYTHFPKSRRAAGARVFVDGAGSARDALS